MFAGFERKRIEAGEVAINLVVGGAGPPLLLLHGYPQTLVCWHKVAPKLAEHFTVVCADLRGYGDSDKPAGDSEHARYAKRAMAADQVAVMAALGFERFSLVGHDRGARVAHRLSRDHPDRVERLALLDIIPTAEMWPRFDKAMALATFHWLFLAQPADLPERMIGGDPDFYLSWMLRSWATKPDFCDGAPFDEYARCFRDPAAIHASCEDYRAGATIDLRHDAADRDARVRCPLLVLWGDRGGKAERRFNFLDIWRERADDVRGGPIPCGHFLAEEAPDETYRALHDFLGG